jgi:hypothetical protein
MLVRVPVVVVVIVSVGCRAHGVLRFLDFVGVVYFAAAAM